MHDHKVHTITNPRYVMEFIQFREYDYYIPLVDSTKYSNVDIGSGVLWIKNIFNRKLPNEKFKYDVLCLNIDIRLTA